MGAYRYCSDCDSPFDRVSLEDIAYDNRGCPHCGTPRYDANVEEFVRVVALELIELKEALAKNKSPGATRNPDEYKYLPPSYRAADELSDIVGANVTEKIKALVEAVLDEARRQ